MNERRSSDAQIARLEERIKSLDDKFEDRSNTILREIKELKENIVPRLERVETGKLSASDFVNYKGDHAKEHEDIEQRLRFIERYVWGAIAILSLLGFVGFEYLTYLFKNL